MQKLNQKLVEALPTDRDGVTWDDQVSGLGLRVQAGKRSWVIRYRVAGVQRQKSLPGALPLRKAREQAAEIIAAARHGIDSIIEGRVAARTALQAQHARQERSLGKIVALYLAHADASLAP